MILWLQPEVTTDRLEGRSSALVHMVNFKRPKISNKPEQNLKIFKTPHVFTL